MRHWDWDAMVEANRGWLMRLLAGLAALVGSGPAVRRAVWRKALASLVPMESATRRLIYVMARDLPVPPPRADAAPGRGLRGKGTGTASRTAFALADRRRDPVPPARAVPHGREPRLCGFDDWTPRERPAPTSDDDPVDADPLRRRLDAMRAALGDLSAQARRLARWSAMQDRRRAAGRRARVLPLRPGRPPGHLARGTRAADRVLADCHDLAVRCLRMIERERFAG